MPQCRKCAKPFPLRMRIDGRVRMLCNRKYCLECSPFGAHNTRRVEQPKREVCSLCKRNPVTKNRAMCLYCTNKVQRWRLKLACVEAKGSVCAQCGWTGNPVAFDFHHRDPQQKELMLQMATQSWAALKAELEKCDLLCARCHRLEHAQELDAEFWEQVFSYRGRLNFKRSKTW